MAKFIYTSCLLLIFHTIIEAQEPPITVPIVTTVFASHPGAVGGMLTDHLGYVYIADFKDKVWRLNPATAEMEVYASGFYGASGNTFDKNGNLYQASFFGHTISRVSRTGEVEALIEEGLNGPVGMIFNTDNELLVCNCNDQSIQKVDLEGKLTEFARSEHFNCPNGVTIDADGNIYVVSFSGSKIVKITPQGEPSEFVDSNGSGLGHITLVNDVFYATSYQDNKVYRISPDGDLRLLAGTGERGQKDGIGAEAMFSNPNGIYADSTGTYLYINDYIGDPGASGMQRSPFSIRRIELPSLTKIMEHALEIGTIENMKSTYRAYQADPAHAGENTLTAMNLLGWKYLNLDQADKAVALFELNVESHPDSWWVYSSMGAGYMKVNENQKAIEVLQRSLELNPDNTVAKGRLATLGVIKADE